ncbi:hypothetical protein Tco_1501634 [Tanacetum coccineum]
MGNSFRNKDIECARSEIHRTPPYLADRTDFASWQQRIRLYCQGKENGVNIQNSIDEGPFQMGTFRETLAEGTKGQQHIYFKGCSKVLLSLSIITPMQRPLWDSMCTMSWKVQNYLKEDQEITTVQNEVESKFGNIHVCTEWSTRRHRPIEKKLMFDQRNLTITTRGGSLALLSNNRGQGNNAQGGGAAGYGGALNRDLALNVDNVFQADDCDAFDYDVDEAPMAQTMFMANLSSADPIYDKVGSSYDSEILSEVHDHDHYQDAVCEHHEEHEIHDDVQPNYVVDSHVDYTNDSNMILYDQYVKDNAVPVVQSNVSSLPNDAYMMINNDMYEPHAQYVSKTTRNTIVDNSLTAELATYKEQVELYKRRVRFELTKREQKIDEQLRIVFTDGNIKEENLKKELHSVKMQLASTINHNNSMVEEVTSLKKDFKQKENKYLEEFLDMKALKVKVEDKLYKYDESLQTFHMLCKPNPYYNEQNKIAIGYKNHLCLTHAKQVQPALYNGYEIIKNNHVSASVHNTEDTLEIAEITRMKMNDKMKDPECATHKVKIAPPDYSKENYLATFIPHKQLTPEQIFWS